MLVKIIIAILCYLKGAIAFAADPVTVVVPPATTTTTTTVTQTPATVPAQSQSVPGGYNTISVLDGGVTSAANFAAQSMQQGTLVKIESAQMQVVAGKNYAMDIILMRNGLNYRYHVVVYVPLPSSNQPMQLTNVEAMGQVL